MATAMIPAPTRFSPDRMREARQDAGLTQAQLAARAGVPASCIANYEQDRVSPSARQLAKVADGLGRPVGDLFTGGVGG